MSWYDAPIREADVIAGEPHTRSWDLHASRVGGVSMNYWDCTAGRFRWHYAGDEMIEILEGEVHVTDEDDHTVTLRPGDTAHVRVGTTLEWHVPVYVRKLAFNRSAQTLPDRVLSKMLRTFGTTSARPAAGPSEGRRRRRPAHGLSRPDVGRRPA